MRVSGGLFEVLLSAFAIHCFRPPLYSAGGNERDSMYHAASPFRIVVSWPTELSYIGDDEYAYGTLETSQTCALAAWYSTTERA